MMPETKQTPVILVVDDTPGNIDVLSNILKEDYRIKAALNGEKALKIASAEPRPDMILLDVMMPDMDGYEVCRRLKANPLTAGIPVIFITAMNTDEDEARGLQLGAVDYITKPINPAITQARIRTHLALHDQNRELEQKVRERTAELEKTRLEIIQRLGRAAEFKDNETGLHVMRMSHYSKLLAEAVSGEPGAWSELIFQASAMHDIGKIGIPDYILTKPARLEREEWQIMKQHPVFGGEILGDHESELLKTAWDIALCHHEKWDGSGYPAGLKGEEIPLSARIAAIADVFDALTSSRPYKDAWPVEEASAHIIKQAGRDFDPALVDHFKRLIPEFVEIRKRFGEFER